MKRALKSSALFAAPLIIASSLFSGAALADRQVIALQLDTVCTDVNSRQAIYAFENKNDFTIKVDWHNLDTGSTGVFNVPGHSFNGYNQGTVGYATDYNPSNPNNTTTFNAEGWTSPNSTNARVGVACTPDQLPAMPANIGSTGNNGGDTTTTVPTSTVPTANTTDNGGGKGGDTLTAASAATVAPAVDTSATLADTGVQQIVPLTAAAVIAVAMLGTTIAVRKNVL